MSQIMDALKGIITSAAFTVFVVFIPTGEHSEDISFLLLLQSSTNDSTKPNCLYIYHRRLVQTIREVMALVQSFVISKRNISTFGFVFFKKEPVQSFLELHSKMSSNCISEGLQEHSQQARRV